MLHQISVLNLKTETNFRTFDDVGLVVSSLEDGIVEDGIVEDGIVEDGIVEDGIVLRKPDRESK